MPRAFTPKVITGNALIEGDVIYLAADDSWTRDFAQALVLTDEADAQVSLIEAQRRAAEIVGAYLADVTPEGDSHRAGHRREDIRSLGPTNYVHGKQEAQSLEA